MGFIVYEEESGRAVKYYKTAATAKSQVTRHNKELRYPVGHKHRYWEKKWTHCSYSDYEGVLMGMSEPHRKVWVFCRG
jgi:hypothetical protein